MSNPDSPPSPPSPHEGLFLTDAQLRAELQKCEFCEERPCLEACPAHCSPAGFIRAAQVGQPSDYLRAAAVIMTQNPLGGICGMVCPDFHCMAACVHRKLDGAVEIPKVQATLVQRAKELGRMPALERAPENGKKVGVVGAGPAGLAAAAMLAQQGYAVTIFDRDLEPGGMCNCIPDFRLDKGVLQSDIQWMLAQGGIELELGHPVEGPLPLLEQQGLDGVVVATGLWTPYKLGIPGEQLTLDAVQLLRHPEEQDVTGRSVAVVGGGATAFDCALTALDRGAARVEMLALETLDEMPLTQKEMWSLVRSGVDVSGRVRLSGIRPGTGGDRLAGVETRKVRLKPGAEGFSLAAIEDLPGTDVARADIDCVVLAIGLRSNFPREDHPRVIYAGDCAEGPTTVVEASAAGKNAAGVLHARLAAEQEPAIARNRAGRVKSTLRIPGYNFRPASLSTRFFQRTLSTPFLLSAAPPTDGLDQMRLAYRAGWSGGIMKTAFDGIPIHIPGEYMFQLAPTTYANCDNVSGHSLSRVCRELSVLVKEFPDRLTMASTGGPVSGDDEADRQQWLSNTHKLENAGAMAIEYSLSCPQGGDGTEGDIVSQNAALTAKIIDWVLAGGDGSVPKLFKLTGAVTSIAAIVGAVKEVFDRHPDKPGGITLANSFPTLAFRPGGKQRWEQGVVVGASGDGILNISYLSLAKVAHLGVHISGNGGPMDYKAAADFLALGCRTVQFCTLVTKYGYGVLEDICSGLSHLMAERGLSSVEQLIGAALPGPVTDFMDLTPRKKLSEARHELCLQCGNCTRCPYLAISLGDQGYPVTDPSRCVGCSICSLKCFSGAIQMRERTPEEAAALKED